MSNKVVKRLKKECAMRSTISAGYPRKIASQWYKLCQKDYSLWRKKYSRDLITNIHEQGYLAKNLYRLGLNPKTKCSRITDLDYLYLQPFNNSYSKWFDNLNTMGRFLKDFTAYLPQIYYSVFNREGLHILTYPEATAETTVEDVLKLLEQKQQLVLRPSFFASSGKKYTLTYIDEELVWVGRTRYKVSSFAKLLGKLGRAYVICDCVQYDYPLTESWDKSSYIKFYIANDCGSEPQILFALADVFDSSGMDEQFAINQEDGTFVFARVDSKETIAIPHWPLIRKTVTEMAAAAEQISYFTLSVAVTETGFTVTNCGVSPSLPKIMPSDELNNYLLARVREKKSVPITFRDKMDAIQASRYKKHVKKCGKKGIRPYMQKLWEASVASDKKWKGTTKEQKKWAWERGFLSFRIDQYGLTEENYKNFLSDYDYHWLNRINGVYQGWINDKLTFRYIMEPFKQYIPSYYFSVYKRRGENVMRKLPDCPAGFEATVEGICALLRQEKKLAFKAAAGTHGDGFYALEYCPDTEEYLANGQVSTVEDLEKILFGQKTYYVLTSYIEMHPLLKSIYPQSVNSVRIMVINNNGYDPQIMQTYLRIGSSKTGYTDNVGYGGICAMINTETGELYKPETLSDHVYYDCPTHPDTGTQIEGQIIPNWELVKEKVLDICRLIPDLEYLGFDVAVTEDSFNIMEINIHQDLHKVAWYSEEIMDFFHRKIRYKERLNGLPYSV